MVKFPEATQRIFKNVFVCRRCKTKQRASQQRILAKRLACKKCGCKAFRTLRKGKTAAAPGAK